MFKFKMSLLLQNVKFRVEVATLILAAIIAGVVLIPKNKAGNVSESVSVVANESGVSVNGVKYLTITKYGQAQGYNNLFCIEEGANLWDVVTYNNPIPMSQAGNYFTNYNAAMWIANNMYLRDVAGVNGLSNETARDLTALNLANILTTSDVKAKVAQKGLNGAENVTAKQIFDLYWLS